MVPFYSNTVDDRHHRWHINNAEELLTDLELNDKKSHTKFIPGIYKYNSRHSRIELLRGLLDTDGHIDHGNPVFTSVSERLIDDVIEVSRSLGINCNKVNK